MQRCTIQRVTNGRGYRADPDGGSPPTLHDVARVAGVSFKTVSNVINDHPQVRPTTRERVLVAIAETGYRPNIAARNLRSGRSGVIGLAVPELSQAYFAQLADDVIKAAEARGLVVLIEQTGGQRARELDVLSTPRLALTDGILFCPLGLLGEDAETVPLGSPLVILGDQVLEQVDHITMQHEEAARAAIEHLIGLGRRRILLLGAHPSEAGGTAGLRFAGYRAALENAGLPLDDALVVPIQTWDRSNGAAAMAQFLETGRPFDAVFAMNDDLAVGVLRTLQEHGRRVPEDVALIGFDDVDEGRFTFPSLSTVDPGRRQIAELAVDMLLERIAQPYSTVTPRVVAPPFRVVARESTLGRSSA
jgi:DNA-binding LacI/PurR family transcriptional regulator